MPKVARIESATLKVKHPIIFRDQMEAAAGPRDARELGDDAIRVWNRMKDVTAERKVERVIRGVECENALMLES